jgi:hypothetical protein
VRALLVLILLTSVVPSAIASGELLGVDAMAVILFNSGGTYSYEGCVFAYEDCQVWRSSTGQGISQLSDINRPVRVKKLLIADNAHILYVLYADDQVWMSSPIGSNFSFRLDASRPGTNVTDVTIDESSGGPDVWRFTYTDGQVWAYGYDWTRLDWAERLNPASSVGGESQESASLRLLATPNPATADILIQYDLPTPTTVTLEIFTAGGALVRRIDEGYQPAGRHSVAWDAHDAIAHPLPSGVYLARLTTREGSTTARVVVAR